MDDFAQEIQRELEEISRAGLRRDLRPAGSPAGTRLVLAGKSLLNFSSNDYLGLARHPAVCFAAAQAIAQFGAGSTSSRLICGSWRPHQDLETALAAFKNTEAALSFSSGYAAALGAVGCLMCKGDVVVLDRLAHACLVDAARLSGARLRVFAHNDPADLADKLAWAELTVKTANPSSRNRPARILVVTESVFSMDGDTAPLREIAELKDRHGAWLMVDEAHATGVYGVGRRGVIEELGLTNRVEIQMGTLGKALGASGGFIAGARPLVDLLINRARSFIFSTAPVPAAAAATTAALEIISGAEGAKLQARLWDNVDAVLAGLARTAWPVPQQRSPILPLLVGDENAAVHASARLRELGVFVPAIRHPAVGRGRARLRLTLSAAHTPDDLRVLLSALREIPPH